MQFKDFYSESQIFFKLIGYSIRSISLLFSKEFSPTKKLRYKLNVLQWKLNSYLNADENGES